MRSLIPRQHVSVGLGGTSGETPLLAPFLSFNPHFLQLFPLLHSSFSPSTLLPPPLPPPLLIPLPPLSVILISSKTSFPGLWELADSEGHCQTLTDSSHHKQLVGVCWHAGNPPVSDTLVLTGHFFCDADCYFPCYCFSSL